MTAANTGKKPPNPIVGKLAGTVGGLAIAGLGAWVMAGTIDLNTETGRAKTQFYKKILLWSIDTIGSIPTGIVMVLLGVLVIYASWKPSPAPESPAESPIT